MGSRRFFGVLATVAALSACGGGSSSGGGQSLAVTPSPTPTPTPTPTPSPTPSSVSGINSRVGLTQLAQFPALSWIYRPDVAGDADGSALVQFGWDAQRRLSVVTVPGFPTGALIEFPTETTDDLSFSHIDPNFGSSTFFDRGVAMLLLVPGTQNRIFPLEYTSAGWIGWQGIATAAEDKVSGTIVYGVPTAATDLPASGTASFALYGYSASRPAGQTGQASLGDAFTGTLEADFAARRLTGSLGRSGEPRVTVATATIAADGTFSGTLTLPGDPGPTNFEGRFTGPQARELMIRWRTSIQFGTLAGRRS